MLNAANMVNSLILLLCGSIFALIFILNNVVRTVQRRKQIGFWELTLAFSVVLLPVGAVIADNQIDEPTFGQVEALVLIIVTILMLVSVPLTIIELISRPERLRQSRGILGIGMSVLLIFGAFITYGIAFGFALIEEPVRIPTPINQAVNASNPCNFQERFGGIFLMFFPLLSDETGLTIPELFQEVNSGDYATIEDFIAANGGELDSVIENIVELGSVEIDKLVNDGCITPIQGNVFKGQLENILRPVFTQPLDEDTLGGFDLQPRDIEATLTATVLVPTNTPTLTPTASPTPSVTPTPTSSRTPMPTNSPTPTRERFVSPTPTATSTLPNPCLAVANFNVNLRSYPDLEDSEVLVTVPYESIVPLYARNEDSTWWFGEYEGEAGWLSNEFIGVTSACDNLPVRRP